MIEAVLLGAAIGSTSVGAAIGFAIARRGRASQRARISSLEDEIARERAVARRRVAELSRDHERRVRQLERALGMPLAAATEPMTAPRRLADLVRERLSGLLGAGDVVLADASGLAFAPELGPRDAALAACASHALTARIGGRSPREVHAELADARHVVVRPLAGRGPLLALAVSSSSRPVPSLALDCVAQLVASLRGEDDEAEETDALRGYPSSWSGTSLGPQLLAELADEAARSDLGAIALGVGTELFAVHATDGPPSEQLVEAFATLRGLSDRLARRLGGRVRRLDWTTAAGSTLSLVSTGPAGRTHLLAVRRQGRADTGAFDRLAGRLRRMLPAEPATRQEERA